MITMQLGKSLQETKVDEPKVKVPPKPQKKVVKRESTPDVEIVGGDVPDLSLVKKEKISPVKVASPKKKKVRKDDPRECCSV